jgi:hypothetical protein
MAMHRQPVEIVGIYSEDGIPLPQRCRVEESGQLYITIKIDQILERMEEKKGTVRILIYRCRSFNDGDAIDFELRYDVNQCYWELTI